MQWNKTYGGTGADTGCAVVQNSDGGYAIAGRTASFGAGGNDIWLIKTDATGNMLWNKTYGGTGTEQANAMVQTSDGGYAIFSPTTSLLLVAAKMLGLLKLMQRKYACGTKPTEEQATNTHISYSD